MNGTRCVVFDIDDTLYLERDYVRSGLAAAGEWAARERRIEGLSERAWAAFERGVRGTTFDVALEEGGVEPDAALVADLVAAYRAHAPSIDLLADARACLDRLHAMVSIAIVTDGPAASQRVKAAALRLDRWCTTTVLTEELGMGFGKPHPRAFEIVQQRAGVPGAACVYVADNPAKDFGGPKSLGWSTIRIRRPEGLHREAPSGPDVDHELTDLSGTDSLL